MYLEKLTVALKNKFDAEQRNGTHVSDITLCPRKSVFRKLQPQPLTMRELNFFTSGRAIHDAIQILAQSSEDQFEIEKEIECKGVVGHVDLYDVRHNIPIECKSMRVKYVEEPKPFHVKQLHYYMTMLNADKGVLLYQCLLNFDEHPFREFEITMSKSERKDRLDAMEFYAKNFQESLKAKNPAKAVHVFNNEELNWLCKSCPYYKQCEEMQGDMVHVD